MRFIGQTIVPGVIVALGILSMANCREFRSRRAGESEPILISAGTPSQELKKGLSKLETAYPYRITERLTYSGSPAHSSTTRVVEYAAANRIHYRWGSEEKVESANKNDGDYEGEWIEIENKNYDYHQGKWIEIGPGGKTREIEEIIGDHMADVRLAGSEDLTGIPCVAYTTRYEFEEKSMPGSGTSKVWISISDGLPRQLDSQIKKGDRVYTSHKVYEYDTSIRVEKPIP